MNTKDNRKRLFDIILVASLLVIALSAFLILYLTRGTSSGAVAVVRLENEVIATLPLDEDGIFEINGGTHTVQIRDGRVSIVRASCHGYQDCVEHGEILGEWDKIVCLPYRIIITVEGEENG